MTWLPPPQTAVFPVRRALCILGFMMCAPLSCVVAADVPRVPFAGVYGATAGGGSLTGWERSGGDNPAVAGPPGYGLSLSGYAPFGLADLRVTELEVSRDAARGGVSLGWRHLADEAGPDASRVRVQGAWRFGRRANAGAFVSTHLSGMSARHAGKPGGGDEGAWWGAGAGFEARPHRALSWGLLVETVPSAVGRVARAGVGVEVGTSLSRALGAGSRARVSVEYFRESVAPAPASGRTVDEWRFALGLRLHALLGVYAGYAPARETAALGVAFGTGGWEGFSAVRRHAALGGTAVQGLRWGRRDREANERGKQ